MSKTQRKKRNRLGLNPREVTYKMLYKMQTHLFTQAQKLEKKEMNEAQRINELTEILHFMQLISKQLVKRGALTKHG